MVTHSQVKMNSPDSARDLSIKQEADDISVKQEDEDVSVKQEDEDVSVKQEDKDISVKQENEDISVKQEHKDISIKQEAVDVSIKQEHKDISIKQEAKYFSIKQEHEHIISKQEPLDSSIKQEPLDSSIKQEHQGISVNQEAEDKPHLRAPAVREEVSPERERSPELLQEEQEELLQRAAESEGQHDNISSRPSRVESGSDDSFDWDKIVGGRLASNVGSITSERQEGDTEEQRCDDPQPTTKTLPVKKYACKQCDKSFNMKYQLRSHRRVHTGEKPFRCKRCGMRFSHKCNMQKHLRSHARGKHFQCEHCDWSSRYLGKLQRHHRVHGGEFRRTTSNEGFTQTLHLENRQQLFRTGEKTFLLLQEQTEPQHLQEEQQELRQRPEEPAVSALALLAVEVRKDDASHRPEVEVERASDAVVAEEVSENWERTSDGQYSCPKCSKSFTSRVFLCGHMRRSHTHEGLYRRMLRDEKVASVVLLDHPYAQKLTIVKWQSLRKTGFSTPSQRRVSMFQVV